MPEQKEHLVPTRNYLMVLVGLLVLLVITVVMAFINLDHWAQAHHLGSGWNTAIALIIATMKCVLIFLIFMHIRYASRLTRIFAVAGFVWLGIMLSMMLMDYFSRNHPAGTSPRGEPNYIVMPEHR